MPEPCFRILQSLLLFFLLLSGVFCPGCVKQKTEWNVLLITLDTTRADHLSCYGYSKITSPNIDALAKDGVRFDMAISTSAVTPMSHASILTGLYPHQHGLRVFYGQAGHFLEESVPNLAAILKNNGWRTSAFISAYPASERFGLHWGFDVFDTGVSESIMNMDPGAPQPLTGAGLQERKTDAQRRSDATTDKALEWLKTTDAPFFLWLHYFDPHDFELIPPKKYVFKFGAQNAKAAFPKKIYDPEIFYMDLQLARVIKHLKNVNEYDNTVIVVVADHGQGLGQHKWFAHRLLYQEQIRLPLIMRVPNGPRDTVVRDLVRSIDIMPTILDSLNVKLPPGVTGISLLDLMDGSGDSPQFALAEALNTIDVHAPSNLSKKNKDDLFCITDGTWKLIYHKHQPENSQLYHLKIDTKEKVNLYKKRPKVAANLLAKLKKTGIMAVKKVNPKAPMDQDAIDKLNSLGYGK